MLAGTRKKDLPNRLAGLELEGQDTGGARVQGPARAQKKKLQPHGNEDYLADCCIPSPLASFLPYLSNITLGK
jgi:hypothetical protein